MATYRPQHHSQSKEAPMAQEKEPTDLTFECGKQRLEVTASGKVC
jgi:hypothetical protein